MDIKFELDGPKGKNPGVWTECENDKYSDCVLLMAHGFRGSMDSGGKAIELAHMAAAYCHVVRFNFQRCALLTDQVTELKFMIDKVREKFQPRKLILLGRSYGGATSIVTACSGEKAYEPDALVLWSTPGNLEKTFIHVMGKDNFADMVNGKDVVVDDERGRDLITSAFVRDIYNYNLSEILAKWPAKPILIIHGEKDEVVTPEQAEENFELVSEPKRLQYMKGCDHSLTPLNHEAAEIVTEWIQAVVKF